MTTGQRVINRGAFEAFSMPMLEHAVATRVNVPRIELPLTVPVPLPDAVQAGSVGTLPVGAEKVKAA
jgi:hypothetical protein